MIGRSGCSAADFSDEACRDLRWPRFGGPMHGSSINLTGPTTLSPTGRRGHERAWRLTRLGCELRQPPHVRKPIGLAGTKIRRRPAARAASRPSADRTTFAIAAASSGKPHSASTSLPSFRLPRYDATRTESQLRRQRACRSTAAAAPGSFSYQTESRDPSSSCTVDG